ncbi:MULTISPECIES: hypothetical protein [unclassified Cytobacillus]|uniref:hypothetical protein n=1 Tax=unclassified Cytobacillus TaxID=2675268 RepID=UPI00135AB000|nr:hypothetical protein [Cytobacillus sp. AMY 15.2]KAF0817016.1 hypothetical protein KIS4809_4116 [Bacillus sp. ZZV12-4809]MCM3090027.1 hypothetical protein [Cytobacillus sp. AMY 15.2]
MRQYIITGMNGAHYYGYPQIQYGPWWQAIHQGYPFHSVWHQSHLHTGHYIVVTQQGYY